MKETSLSCLTDSNPVVMLTQGQLRELIKQEIHSAMVQIGNSRARRSDVSGENSLTHKRYFSIAEAAKFTTLAVSTLRLYGRRGKLQIQKVGKRCVVSRDELHRLLTQNGGETA